MKRALLLFALLPAAVVSWHFYGLYLASTLPPVEIHAATALPVSGEKTLPFYELMSPLPSLDERELLPRLEYKKGPPDRFIERITLLVQSGKGQPKERIVYHGRRTRTDLAGIGLLPEGTDQAARYLEMALRLSQGQEISLDPLRAFLIKPLLLREATRWLQGAESVHVMEQAGTPAFLFKGRPSAEGRVRSSALFVRRNSFYRVDYIGDRGYRSLEPLALFRKSFLTEKRADALEFLAKNLSEVRLEQKERMDFRSIAWPILLLAANVSVDPSSLDAYFHFAGISALLHRSVTMDQSDTETLDVLRNNVLASEFYARDVSPGSRKAAEIGRLARLLTRNFE